MTFRQWLKGLVPAAAAVGFGLTAGGCDDGDRPAGPQTRVAARPTWHGPGQTRPTTSTSTTAPADTRPALPPPRAKPAVSQLLIDGRLVQFPAAKIRLSKRGGRTKATLFSDNPRDAIETDYDGNSFYFDMPLEGDPENPPQLFWRFTAPNSERSDSPNGVYLNGLRTHLQPFDVLVRLDESGTTATVRIVEPSQFRSFQESEPDALAPVVVVAGELTAEVVTGK